MRTSVLAMIVVAGSAIAFPAAAQQKPAAPSEQTKEQMQRDADKGAKTRNSGESGYLADQISRVLLLILRADRKPRARLARLGPRNRTRGTYECIIGRETMGR